MSIYSYMNLIQDLKELGHPVELYKLKDLKINIKAYKEAERKRG